MPDRPLSTVPEAAPNGAPSHADALATGHHAALLVDVVALTADLDLYEAAREAVGERNPVWRARSAEEAADLLISGRCGVLLLDTASVANADTLIGQIVEQFPDVVICVAGERADEPLLAPLLSDGLVYRFMHKPATPKRAAMFLQAAIRHHVERREGRVTEDAFAPLLRTLRQPATGWRQVYVLLALLVALAFALPFALEHTLFRERAPAAAAVVVPAVVETGNRADPVLSRARAALQAGRLDEPEGRNSLDLFRAVLLAQPQNAEAQQGLRQTLDALLARAEQELATGRRDAARATVQRVLDAEPGNEHAARLAGRIDPPDTPSRQLAREQVAEARLTEPPASRDPPAAAPLPLRSGPPATTGPAPATTSPPSVPSAVRPAAVAPARSAVPQPDPLAPRFVNTPPAAPARAGRTARAPTYAAPAGPRHDIAGYARPVAEPALVESTPSPPGPTVAADEFDRVYALDPEYPPAARRAGVTGWVELEFTIAAAGGVRDVVVVAAEPQGVFDAAARDALAQWRFRPRYVNGQPVAQRSTITMRFDLER